MMVGSHLWVHVANGHGGETYDYNQSLYDMAFAPPNVLAEARSGNPLAVGIITSFLMLLGYQRDRFLRGVLRLWHGLSRVANEGTGGSWTAESAQAQHTLSFETLYAWLRAQHERGEQFYVYVEPGTKIILHRYKLPFKQMVVPPKQNELFKWKKGAKRLSDWMVQGGFAPIAEGIGSLRPPTLVAPPPQQSQREARRASMWERVASRARARRLTSVEGESEDAALTRCVVRSVMEDSRANEPRSREMTDEEADAFAQELEAELESQQAAAEPPAEASSSSSPSQASPSSSPAQASPSGSPPEPLSEYEQQRLRNIARNRQVLEGLGLASEPLVPPRPRSQASAERRVRPAPGPPTRRSTIERPARNYAEQGGALGLKSRLKM